jgi:hypothetical protein
VQRSGQERSCSCPNDRVHAGVASRVRLGGVLEDLNSGPISDRW